MNGPWDWDDKNIERDPWNWNRDNHSGEGDWWNSPDYDPALEDPELNNIDYVDDHPEEY